jgi:hypothetical protein
MDAHQCRAFDANKMNAVTFSSSASATGPVIAASEQQQQLLQLVVPERVPEINPHKCSYPHCKKGELMPNVCKFCSKSFCLKHRLQDTHKCASLSEKKQPTNAGIFKLAKTGTAAQEMRAALKAPTATKETCATAAARSEGQTNVALVSRLLRVGGAK